MNDADRACRWFGAGRRGSARRPAPGARRPVGRAAVLLGAIAVLASCASAPTATPVSPTAGPTSTPTTVPVTATTEVTSVPASTSPTASAPPAPTAALQVGPGALATYTVQAQPAPGSCHYRWVGPDPLPDPSCTPGAVDPSVTQATIGSTICRSGWTATVRPPEDVTEPEKAGSAAAYGYTGPFATAEYDHLVPLELGGDPNDPANLWVEPNDRPGATTVLNSKDGLEDTLNALVCSGRVPLLVAQEAIATDWVTARQEYPG